MLIFEFGLQHHYRFSIREVLLIFHTLLLIPFSPAQLEKLDLSFIMIIPAHTKSKHYHVIFCIIIVTFVISVRFIAKYAYYLNRRIYSSLISVRRYPPICISTFPDSCRLCVFIPSTLCMFTM